MKYPTTQFKSLKIALKELEPFIRNGQHLTTGKPFKKFGGMRSREMLANWLLCVSINWAEGRDLVFGSDLVGGDGLIFDSGTGDVYPTEHVMVPKTTGQEAGSAEALILEAIEKKRTKGGEAYAIGKSLVVFLDVAAGDWFPDRVAARLPVPLHFAAAWVVGLQGLDGDEYVYNVVDLDLSDGPAPVMRVRIAQGFEDWSVAWVP